MKKSLIALAALATVATAAQAQSSVTLSGRIDESIQSTSGKTAGTETALGSGQNVSWNRVMKACSFCRKNGVLETAGAPAGSVKRV